MTLRFRIIAGYATLVTTTLVALLITIHHLVEQTALRQLDAHHAVEAVEFADMAANLPADQREARWVRHMRLDAGLYKFALFAPGDALIHRSEALLPVAEAYLRSVPDGRAEFGGALRECKITSHRVEGYRLRIITPLEIPLSASDRFSEIAGVTLLLGLALSLVCGAVYARWVLHPLVRMEDAARRVGVAGAGARIPADIADSADEIGRLARLLNSGYERIDASMERLRRFSAEVSHELRTPLSIVRLNAERVRATPGAPEPVRELAAEQLAEIERLNRFIANLLGFAKLDAGAVRMDRRENALAAWLTDFAEDAAALAEDAGCRFELAPPPRDAIAKFDPVWLRQVLFNLLSNALRVSPPGGLVRAGAEATDGEIRLWMEDEGPGLPAEKLQAIFERYVRFGEERGPAEGVGLGLAISRSIIELHDGHIHAENRAGQPGLRVVITLPR